MIRPFDRDAQRESYRQAEPFPFVAFDDFLEPEFAREVAASYPDLGTARSQGREFSAINEKGKIQITDSSLFPPPVARLNELVSGQAFLRDLQYITGIDDLLYDPSLAGGGMHVTGPQGRLDVHVDFNYLESSGLHRRLNILIYLNEGWRDEWGGAVELWDDRVKTMHHSFTPILNRCVVFETSERSFHGVAPVTCPEGTFRASFAAYYYTKQPPAEWDGSMHSTIFKARPNEKLRGGLLMPLEKAQRVLWPRAKRALRRLAGRA